MDVIQNGNSNKTNLLYTYAVCSFRLPLREENAMQGVRALTELK